MTKLNRVQLKNRKCLPIKDTAFRTPSLPPAKQSVAIQSSFQVWQDGSSSRRSRNTPDNARVHRKCALCANIGWRANFYAENVCICAEWGHYYNAPARTRREIKDTVAEHLFVNSICKGRWGSRRRKCNEKKTLYYKKLKERLRLTLQINMRQEERWLSANS